MDKSLLELIEEAHDRGEIGEVNYSELINELDDLTVYRKKYKEIKKIVEDND